MLTKTQIDAINCIPQIDEEINYILRDYRIWIPEHSTQILTNVHSPGQCIFDDHCSVHRMSDHPMRGMLQVFCDNCRQTERECEHGDRHADPDDQRSVHLCDGCDGCCRSSVEGILDIGVSVPNIPVDSNGMYIIHTETSMYYLDFDDPSELMALRIPGKGLGKSPARSRYTYGDPVTNHLDGDGKWFRFSEAVCEVDKIMFIRYPSSDGSGEKWRKSTIVREITWIG